MPCSRAQPASLHDCSTMHLMGSCSCVDFRLMPATAQPDTILSIHMQMHNSGATLTLQSKQTHLLTGATSGGNWGDPTGATTCARLNNTLQLRPWFMWRCSSYCLGVRQGGCHAPWQTLRPRVHSGYTSVQAAHRLQPSAVNSGR